MIQTNCQGCIFAKLDNGVQTDCNLKRIEKLGMSSIQAEDNNQYKTLSSFCNAFRPKEWVDRLSLEESLNPVETVMEEIKPRVGFLVILNTEKNEASLSYLESTLMSIRDQTDSSPRYVVVATDKVEYNEGIHAILQKFFNQEKTFIHVLQLLERPENDMFIVDEAFRLALNGWLYVTTSGEPVDRNLLKDLHEHINIKMKKLSVVLPYEGINGLLFQTALFKYVNGNKTKIWDSENLDSRMFLEKVKDLDKSGNCILNWSEVNAA
jgi:hypothetical protein